MKSCVKIGLLTGNGSSPRATRFHHIHIDDLLAQVIGCVEIGHERHATLHKSGHPVLVPPQPHVPVRKSTQRDLFISN